MTIIRPAQPAESLLSMPDVYRCLTDWLHSLDDALTVPVGCYPPITATAHG